MTVQLTFEKFNRAATKFGCRSVCAQSMPTTTLRKKISKVSLIVVVYSKFSSKVTYENAWLIHMRHDSFIWDMTHSYETWLIHMRHDSFIWDTTHSYETWLIHMRHDSFIWDMTHSYETWLIHMRHDVIYWFLYLNIAYDGKYEIVRLCIFPGVYVNTWCVYIHLHMIRIRIHTYVFV